MPAKKTKAQLVQGRRRSGDATLAPHQPEALADDLLVGAASIAAYLGYEVSQTYHALAKGYLPAVKQGDTWVGSKTRLRNHFQGRGTAT